MIATAHCSGGQALKLFIQGNQCTCSRTSTSSGFQMATAMRCIHTTFATFSGKVLASLTEFSNKPVEKKTHTCMYSAYSAYT